MTITPPIKWHGGKHYLAPKLIALMPPHVHYVEPYFGGGAVLLAKDPEGVSELINDINMQLTNFWRVLQNHTWFKMFERTVQAIPFSEVEWEERPLELGNDAVEMAVNFFVRCRQSLAARMKSFAAISRSRTRRGMNEQASAWLTAIDGLPAVHERLKRVVIRDKDALEVIRIEDRPTPSSTWTLPTSTPPARRRTSTSSRCRSTTTAHCSR